MLDINGVEIKPGMRVRTQQPSDGLFFPAPPQIGVVEEYESHKPENLCIRYRAENRDFDQFILLDGKINEVVAE